jgi:hypothetical protein
MQGGAVRGRSPHEVTDGCVERERRNRPLGLDTSVEGKIRAPSYVHLSGKDWSEKIYSEAIRMPLARLGARAILLTAGRYGRWMGGCGIGSGISYVRLVMQNMRTSVIALSLFLAGTMPEAASAAFQIRHFPPCPEGVIRKKTCECRAFVSTRFHVCHPGQYCLRNAFHGLCL